jgi:solute carrier family 25 2-oxodicarboxylate transporter 21
MYPLDVVKTRTQLSTAKSMGVLETLRSIVKNEGFRTLYRGIVSPILAEAPKRAIKFSSNEIYKPFFTDSKGNISWRGSGVAGAMAGMTETIINCPFELVKVRLQAKENKALYGSTINAVFKIVKTEGPLALYKGFEPQNWRNAVWNGAYFAMIPSFKKFMGKPKSKYDGWAKGFVCGFIAGGISTTLNTPFDVVKSRIQNQKGVELTYVWSIPSLIKIYSDEGLKALYKGLAARMFRLAPGGGIMIVVFDIVGDYFRKHKLF